MFFTATVPDFLASDAVVGMLGWIGWIFVVAAVVCARGKGGRKIPRQDSAASQKHQPLAAKQLALQRPSPRQPHPPRVLARIVRSRADQSTTQNTRRPAKGRPSARQTPLSGARPGRQARPCARGHPSQPPPQVKAERKDRQDWHIQCTPRRGNSVLKRKTPAAVGNDRGTLLAGVGNRLRRRRRVRKCRLGNSYPPRTVVTSSVLDQLGQFLPRIEHARLHRRSRNTEDVRALINRLLMVVNEVDDFPMFRRQPGQCLTPAGRHGSSLARQLWGRSRCPRPELAFKFARSAPPNWGSPGPGAVAPAPKGHRVEAPWLSEDVPRHNARDARRGVVC